MSSISGIDAIFSRFTRLNAKMSSYAEPLKEAGDYAKQSIITNFAASGRPRRWQQLATSTLAKRARKGTGSQILVESGNLMNSSRAVITTNQAEVGTNVIYAMRQNFGYKGGIGRGQSRTPARQFMMLQTWDTDPIGHIFSRYLRN